MFDGTIIQDIDIYKVPSTRRNPVIADMFQRLDFMEKRGSGFVKIINAVRKIENVEFYSDRSWFRSTFKNMNYNNEELKEMINKKIITKENTTKNANKNATKKITDVQKSIIKLIEEDRYITVREITEILKKDKSTIIRNIDVLKKEKAIKREGNNRKGYWQVL